MSEFLERLAKLSPKKLALLAMDLQSKLDRLQHAQSDSIAVIGIGCRVPGGGTDPERFWSLLRDGVDAITETPPGRWDVDAFWSADPEAPGKMYSRYGGFLGEIDRFDPHFFGIAPREAVTLDPQQRLLLEVSWEALEHAGQPADALFGSQSGVFVGISGSNYFHMQLQEGDPARLDTYVGTGNAVSVAAGRLSYVLGWHGPSVSIDTACSSSLVAVHLACQSLQNGECRMALAGGVNLILTPELNVVLSRSRMLAPDGRCKTFDASADGFGRSEGCGIVVLKRLADAQADGDRILAVIRGSASNQDGRSSGLTAPNGIAQEALIRQALARARVEPAQIGFVEAHGTGTTLGDPIEINALGAVLRQGRAADRPVLVGSVKTNLGHLDAAAGVVGLIKVVLALERKTIPPHLHFHTPNPHIPWAELPVAVPTTVTAWEPIDGRRIAGVSSFGFSGTNVHVIVEEPPLSPAGPSVADRPLHVMTLSARSEAALDSLTRAYAQHLETTDSSFADVCFTANTGRSHFAHRLAVVADSTTAARAQLLAAADPNGGGTVSRGVAKAGPPTIGFLFTGQGSQYVGMGRMLFETQPAFRRTLERCDELLRPHLERPLLSVLYPEPGAESPLSETAYTQPALFAFEYALAELWQSWGVKPALLLGHSVGEYVAACVAGVFNLEDALMLIATRGRLMQALPRDGAMAAVWADPIRVRAAVAGYERRVSLAAVNGPASVVITGGLDEVTALCQRFEQEGVRTHRLNVSHAFHSPLMEPMLDEFERIAGQVRFSTPRIALVSNVTGQELTAEEAMSPAYWRRHIRETVNFADGMRTLHSQGCTAFVEIGPTPTLVALGAESFPGERVTWLASLRRDRDPWQTLLTTLSELYVRGVDVRWKAVDAPYPRSKVSLPTYPFERERFWIEQTASTRATDAAVRAPDADAGTGGGLYEVAWPPLARVSSSDATAVTSSGTWLILSDGGEVAAALAERLVRQGVPTIVVHAGERDQSLAPFEQLISDATAEGRPALAGVMYFWSLAGTLPDEPTALDIVEAHRRSCRGLLFLVQALLRASAVVRPRVWVFTSGAQLVGEHAVSVAQAAVWGLTRTIAAEQPDLKCVSIDCDPASTGDEIDAEIKAIWHEVNEPDAENQIAFRGGRRHVARLMHARVDQEAGPAVIRGDATYLITGGLGALGLHVARWLVGQGARHLVLMGRRPASPAAALQIAAMEDAGAHVMLAQGDVSRREDVTRVLETVAADMPNLRGVVHAAGGFDDGVLSDLKWSQFEEVFAPKAAGAWHLHDLTGDIPLDFFVMFSSMASVLGSPSQSNYAAANAWMDGLAHLRRAQGRPAISINWGPWADAGMAILSAQNRQRQHRYGLNAMPPDRALKNLHRLIGHSGAQVSVLPIRWGQVGETFAPGEVPPLIGELVRADTASRPAPPEPPRSESTSDFLVQLEDAPSGKRWSLVQAHVREHVVRVLGLDPSRTVDAQQGLRDLGMDSLMALELRHRLQRSVNRALPSTLAFDWPSIDALGAYIARDVLGLPAPGTAAARDNSSTEVERDAGEPIAIVGLACRFPGGADTPAKFWDLLHHGVDAISEVPPDRWDMKKLYDPDPEAPGKMYTPYGGFISNVDRFDAPFFGISRREAISLDPQQRLLLELSWEALEHAGQSPDRLVGSRSGVFVGVGPNDYGQLISKQSDGADLGAYVGTGNSLSVAAGRLSYVLGLQGPSMAVDTACSSSLVAVHLACQSLRGGECRLALVGGVNLMLVPDVTIQCCRAHMLSVKGRCRTFDAEADGYVRAEGGGMIVLKRLSDALADGDRIHAVIRGSAVNQDGRSSGLTVPNGASQRTLIGDALSAARVAPGDVSYVETHGTGTSLGDPIEMRAIVESFGNGRSAGSPLVVGSVKTNVGHLESAAGMAGLLKVVLALEQHEIPAHLHFKTLNPHISLDDAPVVIPTASMPWTRGEHPRIAGVSSFGFSGTNAHVVVEEPPAVAPPAPSSVRPLHLVTLSAKSQSALIDLARLMADHVTELPADSLGHVAHTLNTGRSHFTYRLAAVAGSLTELSALLRSAAGDASAPGTAYGCVEGTEPPGVGFVFGGDASHGASIKRGLYERQPVFRSVLDRCAEILRAELQQPLAGAAAAFAFQYALAQLWKSWGVEPAALTGVGAIGECVAACVAGMISLEDGLALATDKGRVRPMTYSAPHIPLISSVTGLPIGVDYFSHIDPSSRNGTAAQGLSDALKAMSAHGCRVFIELGPLERLPAAERSELNPSAIWLTSPNSTRDDEAQLLESLGGLYALGGAIDWLGVHKDAVWQKVALPTYPFERQRYWAGSESAEQRSDTQNLAFEYALAAGQRQSQIGPLDLQLHTFAGKLESLERLTSAYMVDALRRLGAFKRVGERHSVDGLVERFGVLSTYRRLMARWLDRLAGEGFLVRDADEFVSVIPLPDPELQTVWDTSQDLAASPYIADYVRRCGTHLPDVITGKESPLETLFPGGDPEAAEGLYEHAASARYINDIARAAVAEFAARKDGQTIRVLEIGAGTGATTTAVLPALPRTRTKFWFTDVSGFFLTRAEQKLRGYDFVRYGLLDIEKSPGAHQYPAHAFDIVIAANVLHATTDLLGAVANARELVAPGGLLLLVENTVHHPHFDITIGLVEGWQRFDDEIRSTNPLLSVESWRRVLEEVGFEQVAAVPAAGSPAEILGQSVLFARAPFMGVQVDGVDDFDVARDQDRRYGVAPDAALTADAIANFVDTLVETLPANREEVLVEYVRAHVATVLRADADTPPQRRQRLMDLGLDSLMAVELRNRLAKGLGGRVVVPATLMFDYPTIEAIARYLGKQLLGADWATADNEPSRDREQEDQSASAARIAELSDDEAEALLIAKLESL